MYIEYLLKLKVYGAPPPYLCSVPFTGGGGAKSFASFPGVFIAYQAYQAGRGNMDLKPLYKRTGSKHLCSVRTNKSTKIHMLEKSAKDLLQISKH